MRYHIIFVFVLVLLIWWSLRPSIGEGNGTPFQYSCLENPMDEGAWWAAVHGVDKSWTGPSNFTFTHWRRKWQLQCWFLATHSSTLAWKIPWTEEPGRLQSLGLRGVKHYWATSLSLFTFMHGEGGGNPLQCSCLQNPRDWGAWWAAVSGVAQSRTRLKQFSSSSSMFYVHLICCF